MKKSIFLVIAFIFIACQNDTWEREILIMCGSANKPPMEEIAKLYEKETGTKVHLIFGGSGTLLSQIELSQKGDIYLPGSPDYIIKGLKKNLLQEGTDKIVAYLIPGIIIPSENPGKIENVDSLMKPGIRIAIGNPETVCLGLYAIEILDKNGILEKVMKNIVTFGGSCSQTANLAGMNKVDAIIGWRVFSKWNPAKMKYIPIPPNMIPRISHIPVSIPIYARDRSISDDFIEFLLSEKGKAIYRKYGYILSLDEAKKFAPDASVGGEYNLPEKYFRLIRNE